MKFKPVDLGAHDYATLLDYILSDACRPELNAYEFATARSIRAQLRDGSLNPTQERWVRELHARLKPFDLKKVPRGREVPTADVLKNLPKKPPGRT